MTPTQPLIVGIGASAGGIPAMEGFFRNLVPSSELAFVVVTHLNPTRQSLLHRVLERHTELPVHVIADGMPVEGGNVYVMPENVTLTIEDRRLQLRENDPLHRERKPVDVFLSALAEDQRENAAAIIMSGGDGDGTLGVKAVKERGGVTFAQLPDGENSPMNPEMPESAISAGVIDFALPVERMGERLQQILRGRSLVGDLAEDPERDRLSRAQEEISRILQGQTGHDFSGYKNKTFLRRVARRMQVHQIDSIEAYGARLREDPPEAMALFRDLLINVTEFFRDSDAFDALKEQVIPRLFDSSSGVRAWVPGCATGEEVYSLAMLMREQINGLSRPPRVQLFATDIDEPALSVARAGRYPEAMMRGLSPERRKRFFNKDASSWVINKEVRELCVFSSHSVISDPPFSRMDLVSCRNLLIYLDRQLQDQVIPTFHYALRPGGYLFLGTSEGISQHSDLFTPLDKKQRIFQSREHGHGPKRLPMTIDRAARQPSVGKGAPAPAFSAYHLRQRVELQVLDRHAPAHVVVRQEGDVIYFSAGTARYLEAPRGAPSRLLLEMVRRELRLDLRAALQEVYETNQPTERVEVLRNDSGGDTFLTLRVEPLDGHAEGEPLYLVLFVPFGPAGVRPTAGAEGEAGSAAEAENELRDMRERHQSMVEEYETALEELKSSNEELVSVNEEAQSTNEELEASREEMQSLNEELSRINAELHGKIEELDRTNTDLNNLYEATGIATVFLDGQLVIRNFTPAASTFFNLRLSDIGRPLSDLSSVLDYPELEKQIRQVFERGEPLEHQLLPDGDGRRYLVRLHPYRDRTDDIGGVVVTLVDVTSLVQAEEHQRVLISELNHRVKNMLAIVISIVHATLRHSTSPQAFTATLTDRLHGMARSYALLSRESWVDVSIRDLVEQVNAAHGPIGIAADVPRVMLKPAQALAFGMVLHELATNAVKYGALSRPGGQVFAGWTVVDGTVEFNWSERGGPDVIPPERKGFGLVLIQGQVEQQLGGRYQPAFDREGFSARISFPLG